VVSVSVSHYHKGFTGRGRIDEAFDKGNVVPEIVMEALDADVIKAYVELGLGIGILASMAFDSAHDPHLRLLDAKHLFKINTARVAVRRGTYLRGYALRFIELCSPELTETIVRSAL
jgi:LysR family cys regulon transcriptional activator